MTLLRSALSGICLLGVLGSGIGLARAAPALPGPRATESAAAMKARQKARIAFGARKWTEAEASFEAVLAAPDAAGMTAVQRAEVLGYLGLCELEQGKHREAAAHLGQSLEQDAALSRALLDRFTRAFDTAIEHVGRIYVAASPPDAEILLDGEPVGTGATVHELFVAPGTYTLRARLSGHGEGSQRVEVDAGKTVSAALQLVRAADASARAPAPGAKKSEPVKPQAPGPAASWLGPARIAGIGLTTATASLGALFMVRASASNGDLKERNSTLDALGFTPWACREPSPPSACNELAVLRRERDQFAALGTAMVVASGVVGAMTVASFFTDFSFLQSEPTGARVAFSPAATPGQIGLVAHGVW
ncbi:PEGA domain-containing protein [Sorangium sp. So ce295]|uniref:PEGA domain-containing protein n=1 Tax=Sorangium sp. So ce295 TaxID=3133295 RepID=UPI003F63E640